MPKGAPALRLAARERGRPRGKPPGRRQEPSAEGGREKGLKFGAGRPIDIAVTAVDGEARLAVIDHGIGVPPDRESRIFERFERGVSSRQYGGLGLGLYIVRSIVERLGGEVGVEPTAGGGATFHVELPREPPEDVLAAASAIERK